MHLSVMAECNIFTHIPWDEEEGLEHLCRTVTTRLSFINIPLLPLSFRLFILLSFCHSVFLSFCHSVFLSFCHSVFLSFCHTVTTRLSFINIPLLRKGRKNSSQRGGRKKQQHQKTWFINEAASPVLQIQNARNTKC